MFESKEHIQEGVEDTRTLLCHIIVFYQIEYKHVKVHYIPSKIRYLETDGKRLPFIPIRFDCVSTLFCLKFVVRRPLCCRRSLLFLLLFYFAKKGLNNT